MISRAGDIPRIRGGMLRLGVVVGSVPTSVAGGSHCVSSGTSVAPPWAPLRLTSSAWMKLAFSIIGAGEVGALELGLGELGLGQVGALEDGVLELALAERGLLHLGPGEVGLTPLDLAQRRLVEVGADQLGVGQGDLGQVGPGHDRARSGRRWGTRPGPPRRPRGSRSRRSACLAWSWPRSAEVRSAPREVGVLQVGLGEVGLLQGGVAEDRAGQVLLGEVDLVELGAGQVGAAEAARQLAAVGEVGAAQFGAGALLAGRRRGMGGGGRGEDQGERTNSEATTARTGNSLPRG